MNRIRQLAIDMRSLTLSPEEGFVLSRVDGTTTVKELVALTGLDEGRIVDIVGRLREEGAVEVEGASEVASAAPSRSRGVTAARSNSREMPAVRASSSPATTTHASSETAIEEPAAVEADTEGEPFPQTEEPASEQDSPTESAFSEEVVEGQEAEDAVALEPHEATEATSLAPELEGTEDAELTDEEKRNERAYRQIYETVYHPMSRDERIKKAQEVTGSDLFALCFDPDPQIIHAVLSNSHAGFDHARLIALHHRTHVGLEAVAKRSDYIKDALVQRRLLRNPQLPGTILNRMVNPKLIMDVYKIAIDREIPERTRVMTREILRKKFMLASSDEKASLILKTDGRCLILLVNCSLDAHATKILCGKQTYTVLFIQNVARWSASPPALLAHLLKTAVVRRNMGLRKMILKHPNMPSDIKRNFQA